MSALLDSENAAKSKRPTNSTPPTRKIASKIHIPLDNELEMKLNAIRAGREVDSDLSIFKLMDQTPRTSYTPHRVKTGSQKQSCIQSRALKQSKIEQLSKEVLDLSGKLRSVAQMVADIEHGDISDVDSATRSESDVE